MAKLYTIFAVKNPSVIFQLGNTVRRHKETIDLVKDAVDVSFVATDGVKMFIVGSAESLEGVQPSSTGSGSTCKATPAKVQELSVALITMGYTVDAMIAYTAISTASIEKEVSVANMDHIAEECLDDDQVHYGLDIPQCKMGMVESALELVTKLENLSDDSDAFVSICEFYLKSHKEV